MNRYLLLVFSGLLAVATSTAAQTPVTTVVEYPHGAFLENLDGTAGGPLYITSYVDRSVLIDRDGRVVEPWARLDAHPAGVLVVGDRIAVSVHAGSFLGGLDKLGENALLLLDQAGKVERRIPAPDARFLNGLAALSPTRVLAIDSLAGTIWLFDLEAGTVAPWLRAEELRPDPAGRGLGANGLKVSGGNAYVSNTSRGTVYRVAIQDGVAKGPLEPWRRTGPVDDFTLLPDGGMIVATHGAKLLHIAANGQTSALLEEGCDGCTSAAVRGIGASRHLVVLTTGNLLSGGAQPARVIRLPFPGQ